MGGGLHHRIGHCSAESLAVTHLKFNSSPLKRYRDPKGNRLPTIYFQGRAVKLRGCICFLFEFMQLWNGFTMIWRQSTWSLHGWPLEFTSHIIHLQVCPRRDVLAKTSRNTNIHRSVDKAGFPYAYLSIKVSFWLCWFCKSVVSLAQKPGDYFGPTLLDPTDGHTTFLMAILASWTSVLLSKTKSSW